MRALEDYSRVIALREILKLQEEGPTPLIRASDYMVMLAGITLQQAFQVTFVNPLEELRRTVSLSGEEVQSLLKTLAALGQGGGESA